jgi:2,3-bisphosphoglycerate-independent phosphoglycerate mutase
MKRPITLLILDGYGESTMVEGNAILQAKTTNLDAYRQGYPFCLLQASGMSVGLPWGDPGNSEVGHLCLGAGRIVYQNLPRITVSIQSGTFYQNEAFQKTFQHVKKHNSKLHFVGLVSSGSVHSDYEHLEHLLRLAGQEGLSNVYIQAFTDGRDAPIHDAVNVFDKLTDLMKTIGVGKIATFSGRMYGMDRDNHWDRIELAFNAMVHGQGDSSTDYHDTLSKHYASGQTDEFIPPTILDSNGLISENDGIIIFNFREDRARQITKALALPSFAKFNRNLPPNLFVSTMVEYEEEVPVEVAYPPLVIDDTLSEYLSHHNKNQVHISETEKYAHVTYFLNGGIEEKWPNEDWILIPSTGRERYSETPEMKAQEIREAVVKAIQSTKYDLIVANFANPDMVGHTGDFEATKQAIEFLDNQIKEIVEASLEYNGVTLITADHGNAEYKINLTTGQPSTSHTTNPVPFYLIAPEYEIQDSTTHTNSMTDNRPKGILADVAPTILDLMGLEKPEVMTGYSLVKSLKLDKA